MENAQGRIASGNIFPELRYTLVYRDFRAYFPWNQPPLLMVTGSLSILILSLPFDAPVIGATKDALGPTIEEVILRTIRNSGLSRLICRVNGADLVDELCSDYSNERIKIPRKYWRRNDDGSISSKSACYPEGCI